MDAWLIKREAERTSMAATQKPNKNMIDSIPAYGRSLMINKIIDNNLETCCKK